MLSLAGYAPVARPTVYLSEEAYRSALELHRSYTVAGRNLPEATIRRAGDSLGRFDWMRRYDEVYLALYALSLGSRFEQYRIPPAPLLEGARGRRDRLELLLEIELTNDDSPWRLLDEIKVARFISLRRSIESFVPFRSSPASISFGCILLGVDLWTGNANSVDRSEADPSRRILDETFHGKKWSDFMEKNGIVDFQLSLSRSSV